MMVSKKFRSVALILLLIVSFINISKTSADSRLITEQSNLILNPSNEDELVNGELPHWSEAVGNNWTQRKSDPAPQHGSAYFFAGVGINAELYQDVDVSPYADHIDQSRQTFEFSGYVRAWPQTPSDSSRIILEYRNAANQVIDTFDSEEVSIVPQWKLIQDIRIAPTGTRSIRIRLISTRYNGENNDGYYDNLTLIADDPIYNPIDIKVRAFIPCGAVTSPTGDLFGGDNRSFAYSGGQSRFEEHLVVTMDPTFANPIIERPSSRYWESTRLYTSLDDAGQQNGTGNQEWCRQLISSPSVPEIRPASIGSLDRPAYGGKLQSGEGIAIEFFMEAGNAFLGGTPPKLDANIVVFLRQNEGNEPEYRIYGKHDGFPGYEIYLNQQLVYCHDPIRSGDSPSSLFGGLGFGGVTADTRTWKEIQAIDCSPIKGIRTNSPIGEKASKFTVTGIGFNSSNLLSANSVATITSTVSVYINNVLLGEVNTDENGRFQVVLDTANASYGVYEVVASNNFTTTTFSTEFQLQADSFLIQELDGVATSFSIPPDIAYPPFSIFLPNIQR